MSRQQQEPGRKGMSRWSMLWVFLLFFILISFAMQKCGIKIMNQTEDSELIDKPHRNR
ncbi:MAG: hypothetical protein HUU01_12860 [Saprospiraceae bacterium]|nr:hypothetical protein [Saprospiraceae bacterium]